MTAGEANESGVVTDVTETGVNGADKLKAPPREFVPRERPGLLKRLVQNIGATGRDIRREARLVSGKPEVISTKPKFEVKREVTDNGNFAVRIVEQIPVTSTTEIVNGKPVKVNKVRLELGAPVQGYTKDTINQKQPMPLLITVEPGDVGKLDGVHYVFYKGADVLTHGSNQLNNAVIGLSSEKDEQGKPVPVCRTVSSQDRVLLTQKAVRAMVGGDSVNLHTTTQHDYSSSSLTNQDELVYNPQNVDLGKVKGMLGMTDDQLKAQLAEVSDLRKRSKDTEDWVAQVADLGDKRKRVNQPFVTFDALAAAVNKVARTDK